MKRKFDGGEQSQAKRFKQDDWQTYFWNAKGTVVNDPKEKGYDSWIEYYDAKLAERNLKYGKCCVDRCDEDGSSKRLEGGHVHITGDCDRKKGEPEKYAMFILKLCSDHNDQKLFGVKQRTKRFNVSILVSVEDQKCTCGEK